MDAIDLTTLQKRNKSYARAIGNKIAAIYDSEQYMLKFLLVPQKIRI